MTNSSTGAEGRQPVTGRVSRRILEHPHAIGRLVWSRDDETVVAIAVGVAWNRPGPEAHAEIDDEPQPAVVMCHGNDRGSMTAWAIFFRFHV